MKSYDLFICYSSKDRAFVHKLAHDLKVQGLEIWLDYWEMLPGDRLRERINEGIAKSKFLLVVLSPNSVNSRWVKIELDSAMIKEMGKSQIVVIPVLLGNVSPESIPLDIQGKLYLDFSDPEEYETNLGRILRMFSLDRKSLPFEYEILYSHTDIDIKDIRGSEVIITKLKRIKVLEEQLVFNHEEFYADGLVDSFEAIPGTVISINKTLGKYEIITDFGRPLQEGEEFEQTVKCQYHNSFPQPAEYWLSWHAYPIKLAGYTIHFPKERPYKSYRCKIKTGTYERDYATLPQEIIIGGRPCITINVNDPGVKDYCKIEWTW